MQDRDCCEIICGPPKVGKTSVHYPLIEEDLAAGEWVFAQDPNAQFGGLCVRYPTVMDWVKAAQAAFKAKQPLPRGASIANPKTSWQLGDVAGDGLVGFVSELGRRLNHVERCVFPMTLAVDETSLLGDNSGPTHMSEDLDVLANNRRHRGVRMRFNMQRPTQLPAPLWDVVTRVYLFACPQVKRVRLLEERLHLPEGQLEALLTLQNHKYYVAEPRVGIVP